VWDYVLVGLTSFFPFLDDDPTFTSERQAALNRLLDQAVMVAKVQRRSIDTDYLYYDPESDPDYEMNIELAHLELGGGYFETTCIYEPTEVRSMRYMIAYVDILRLLGYEDAEVEQKLIEQAGENSDRVRQFIDYAGLNNIGHFICADYIGARLSEGMDPDEIREYIDRIPPTPPTTASPDSHLEPVPKAPTEDQSAESPRKS
jgi:hypothetical protein